MSCTVLPLADDPEPEDEDVLFELPPPLLHAAKPIATTAIAAAPVSDAEYLRDIRSSWI
jgi:hypothetical protein